MEWSQLWGKELEGSRVESVSALQAWLLLVSHQLEP